MKRSIITLMAAFGCAALAQAEPLVLDESMDVGFTTPSANVIMDCYNFNEPAGAPKTLPPRKKVNPPKPEARPVPPPPAPEPPKPPKKKKHEPAPKPAPGRDRR